MYPYIVEGNKSIDFLQNNVELKRFQFNFQKTHEWKQSFKVYFAEAFDQKRSEYDS